MDVMHPVCCGIDVHQKSIVCCILDGPLTSNEPKKYQTTFGTTTKELNAALDWLLVLLLLREVYVFCIHL